MDSKEDLDKVTEVKEIKNTEIPDWLKGSLSTNSDTDNSTESKRQEAKKDDIPEWLK
jgi:hypothetical protein